MFPDRLFGFKTQLQDFVSEAGFCTFTITCKGESTANNLLFHILTIEHGNGLNIVIQRIKKKLFVKISYPETTPIDEIKSILKKIEEGSEQWRR